MQPKPEERREARRLRQEGLKLREIAQRLDVSLNSACRWTRDIELTPAQREANRSGPPGPQARAAVQARVNTWREVNRERRREYQRQGRERARNSDPLHLAGCMLYWAEGAKSRNQAIFANSDPRMIRLFARFLAQSMEVPAVDLRIRLNVYLNNGLGLR